MACSTVSEQSTPETKSVSMERLDLTEAASREIEFSADAVLSRLDDLCGPEPENVAAKLIAKTLLHRIKSLSGAQMDAFNEGCSIHEIAAVVHLT